MIEEPLYTWIWEGLMLGFGSPIFVSVIMFISVGWFYSSVVDFQNPIYALLFAVTPFLGAGIAGIITLSWGMALAVLVLGFVFASAVKEAFTA